jgi:proline iminopeptidase
MTMQLAAQQAVVPRHGLALHYRTEGSGRPIVFLSGGPGFDVDYIRPAAQLFPANWQRVYLEQRGTGRSRPAKLATKNMTLRLMVEDVESPRAALKLDRLSLAGHSWGGMLAMAYGAAYPERVEGLILISSGGPSAEFQTWFRDNINARLLPEDKQAADRWGRPDARLANADQAALEGMKAILPAYFFDRQKALAFAAQIREGSLHQDALALMSADVAKNYDVRAGLKRVTRPVLIVQGHDDPIGDRTAEQIHGLIAGSTLKYIAECGHFTWVEQPARFRQIVGAFLEKM